MSKSECRMNDQWLRTKQWGLCSAVEDSRESYYECVRVFKGSEEVANCRGARRKTNL